MLRRTNAVSVAAVLALLGVLSGCLADESKGSLDQVGAGDSSAEPSNEPEVSQSPGASAAPSPTKNTTESRIRVDPNQTVEGDAHTHDWWAGDTQVTIMSRTISHGPQGTPVCAGNSADNLCAAGGTSRIYFESSADAKQRPNNVYPGTGKFALKVTLVGQVLQPFDVNVIHPRKGGSTTLTKAFEASPFVLEIPVEEENADPPHFRTSGWYFRLSAKVGATTQRLSAFSGSMHWEVTIHRSERELPIDPPHPDNWEGLNTKVLVAQTRNHDATYAYVGGASYQNGYSDTQLAMPKNATVLPLTGKMSVELTWRGEMSLPTTKLVLGFCPPRSKTCDGGTLSEWTRGVVTKDGTTSRTFEFEVRPDQWDSPYATGTLWRYRWFFDNGSADTALSESGKFVGQVDWKITILKG